MKKSFFWLVVIFILLTTYNPKFSIFSNLKINIQKIIIENNFILDSKKVKEKLNFLYNEKLFFLNIQDIEKNLKTIDFVESFSIKKIYPNKLKIIIVEKTPIVILHNKKEKFYISNKGDLIKFENLDLYNDLPTVFGGGSNFYSLYKDLKNIKFPIEKIKSFYFFESDRWDLIMKDDKVIKLPIEDYLYSLDNFMKFIKNNNSNNHKIFDYRVKDQLILN